MSLPTKQAGTNPVLSNYVGTGSTFSVTVASGNNRLLVVEIGMESDGAGIPEITSITYSGQSLTRWGFIESGTWSRAEVWYLVDPPVGTANVVIANTSDQVTAHVWKYDDVNSTPLRTAVTGTGSAASSSITVTGVTADDEVRDVLCLDSTGHNPVPGADQTERYEQDGSSAGMETAGSDQAGSTGGVMSWTWTNSGPYSHVAYAVRGISSTPEISEFTNNVTSGSATVAAGGNLVIDKPSGCQNGDTCWLFALASDPWQGTLTHADWAQLLTENETGNDCGLNILRRVINGDGSTWTFVSSNSENVVWAVVALRGVDNADPEGVVDGQSNASGQSQPTPTINVTNTGAWILCAFGSDGAGTPSYTPPGSPFVEEFDGLGGNAQALMVGHEDLAGATGNTSRTATLSTADVGVAVIIEVNPAPAGGTTNEETGSLVSTARLAGADVVERAETGSLPSLALLAGVKAVEYVKSGSLVSGSRLGGASERVGDTPWWHGRGDPS